MILEYFNISLLMMRSKPVRSILSLLGIYIGVLALMVILAIREGVREQIEGLFTTQGANVIFIYPGFDPIAKRLGHLTLDDVARLKDVPGVISSMPRVMQERDVHTDATSAHVHFAGVDERFISLYRVPLIRGRSFLKEEIDKKQAVCLISSDLAEKLFPVAEPIGQFVDVQGTAFRIIGVMNWSSEVAQRTSLQNIDMLIPALWLAPGDSDVLSAIEVRVKSELVSKHAVDLVKNVLSHGDAARENLYYVRSMEEFVEKSREMSDKILAALLGIAGISLLVGGIGVANVMITSVTERTREIGIRKALGASRANILAQFLTEASLLSVSGGLLAITTSAIGIGVAKALFTVNFPLVIPWFSSLGCLLLTVAIGLVSGIYPASRAASMSPAEALRYE